MPDSSNPLAWVAYADKDFEFAVLGLEQHPRSATFMLAQASEKYLKALLLHHTVIVPRSHDMVLLLSLVPDAPKPDASESYAAQLISRAVIPNRYPGNIPEPTVDEAKAIQRAAETIQALVRSRLKLA